MLCSPASAASPWVNREVETFIALGRTERIFPVIAAGLPDTDDVERDFFPPALRGLGLLAADLREIKQANGKLVGDGREGGRLKLLAGVLGVGLDQLVRRERKRQVLRGFLGASIAGFLFVVAVIAIGAGLFAAQQRQRSFEVRALTFADSARSSLEAGDYLLAAKYALSGWQVSPRNEGAYRQVLARTLFEADGRAYFVTQSDRVHWASYSSDGTRVVTAGSEGVQIWDAFSGQPLVSLSARQGSVTRARFSTDGRYVVAAFHDGTARAWESISGRLVSTVTGQAPLTDAILTLSNDVIITVDREQAVRAWRATDGTLISTVRAPLIGSSYPSQLSMSEDGTELLTCGQDGIQFWDLVSFTPIESLESEGRSNCSVAFFGAVAGDLDGADVFIRAESGTLRLPLQLPGRTYDSVGISRDGSRVAVASNQSAFVSSVFVFGEPWGSGFQFEARVRGPVRSVQVSPDGSRIVIASNSGVVESQSSQSHGLRGSFSGPPPSDLGHLALTADGGRLMVVPQDQPTIIRDARTGDPLASITEDVSAAAWGPDGNTIAAAWGLGEVWLLDPTGTRIRSVFTAGRFVHAIAFSPDGQKLAVSSRNDLVIIFDLTSNSRVSLIGHEDDVYDISFSPDGRQVVTAGEDSTVRVWNVESGQSEAVFSAEGREAISSTFSPDGRRVVAAIAEDIWVWDLHTQQRVLRVDVGTPVLSVKYSHDGIYLVSSGSVLEGQGNASIWDAQSGSLVWRLADSEAPVLDVELAADGTRAMTLNSNGTVKMWDTSTFFMTMPELAHLACTRLIPPFRTWRSFSSEDVSSNVLISELWLGAERNNRDVGGNVSGALPIADD